MIWPSKRRSFSLTKLPNDKQREQKLTFIIGAILLMIATWNVWQERSVVYWPTGVVSVTLLLIGLFSATGSHKFYHLWMRLAHMLGYINSRILLSLIYFLVVTPYGLILRLFGRDMMNRRGTGRKSYWIPRSKTCQTRQQFERLF